MKEENKYTVEDLPPMSKKEKEHWEKHNDEYYHYLYRIDNKINGKYYYGIHSEKKDGIHKLGEDNYMGSGIALTRAQKKEGIENFEKTIIKTFSTRDEARLEEFIIVNEELVKDPMCYNKTVGGGATNSGVTAVNYKDENLREDNFFLVTTEEYHRNKDKYITPYDNKITIKRKSDGKYVSIPKEEYSKNPELYEKMITVNYKDENLRKDKYFTIPLEEYHKNKDKYVTTASNRGVFKDKNNSSDVRLLSSNDPLVLSGQFVGISKGIKKSKEDRMKIAGEKNGAYGKIWITNGRESKMIKKDQEIPSGWYKGITTKSYINYTNIITGEEKRYTSDDNIPPDFLPSKFFDQDKKLIPYDDIISKYNELHDWEKTAKFFNKGRRTIKKLLEYYNKINRP